MRYVDLTPAEMDALREVGNVGTGNASTALSKILNRTIDIDIPITKFIPVEKFADEMGGAEQEVMGIYLATEGDVIGETLFMFPKEGAFNLIDLMMGQEPGTTKQVDEMGESAFKEMSNIFTGAYLTSLSNMLGISILPGVPHTATDMTQAIIDSVLVQLVKKSDQLLFVRTRINVQGCKIDGTFMLFFDPDSLGRILQLLHEKFGLD
jgi:chemotaxis protein CheC